MKQETGKKNIKCLMNGFSFQYNFLNKQLNKYFEINLKYPNVGKHTQGWKYILLNFFMYRKLYKTGKIKKYDIVHFNNTENFLNYKKYTNQISIAESHGFDFGVNYKDYIKDEKNKIKYFLGYIINKIFGKMIRKKIQEFDIYYCSTPDMLASLKKYVREDVKRLPNPIDTSIFTPKGNIIKLQGNPACFFPTRLHGDKKPEVAIKIFQEYIKPNFPDATLHLLKQGFEFKKYKKLFNDKKTYFWHDFMDKEILASKIRGSDLCFGDFSIGGLSLMPMQIMACKKPIITYDKYEIIKIKRKDLLELTRRLLKNPNFKREYIDKNYKYIMNYHTEESVAKIYLENLKPFLSKIKNKGVKIF